MFVIAPAMLLAFSPTVHVREVTLTSGQDVVKAVHFRPEGSGPFPGLLVLHGDFGLTAWAKEQARRLASKGYVTLAIDLYRGELPKAVEEAHILERALPEERVLRDMRAAVDFLARDADVHKGRLGVIGWDLGGGYALEAAVHDPRIRATVTCSGRLITDPARLSRLRSSVLGIFAGADEGLDPETVKQFQAAMRKAGKHLAGLHVFDQVSNGFLDANNPEGKGLVAQNAAADAWRRIDAYLQTELH